MTSPRTLLNAWQMMPKKQLGQNFLSDPNIAAKIIASAEIQPDDIVLEIGAGLGALTLPASKLASQVYAVEKDRQVCDLLHTQLLTEKASNVTLIRQNIFDVDLKELFEENGRKMIVLGNLPYNISSQVLIRLIENRDYIKHCVLMFQKELAQRIMAPPGNKDYGRISVMLGFCADTHTVMTVLPKSFFPQPKIDSMVVKIDFCDPIRNPVNDEAFFEQVVKAAFGMRRKMLKNALINSTLRMNPEDILIGLDLAAIDQTRRAETLSIDEFIRLSDQLLELYKKSIE